MKKCFEPLARITNLDELRLINSTNWVSHIKIRLNRCYNNSFSSRQTGLKYLKIKNSLLFVLIRYGFGTGLHPTTQMCLQLISNVPLLNKNVIDLGCGSGILGIACAKRGAKSVTFIDDDVVALGITRENIIKNSCQDIDYKITSSLTKNSKKVDYIFANILLNPLKNMAKAINSKLKSKGRFFLAGS